MGIKPLLASEIISGNKRYRCAPILAIAAVSILLVGCSGGNSAEITSGSSTTTTSRSSKQASSTGATGSSGATYATGATGISTTSTTPRNGSTTTKASSSDTPADPATVSTTRAGVTTTTRASVTTTTAATTTTTTRPVVPGAAAVLVSKGPSTTGCSSGSACAYLDVLLTNFTPGQLVTVQCSGTKSSGSFSIGSFSATIGPDGSFNTGLISPCKHGVAGEYVYATVGTVHATHLRW